MSRIPNKMRTYNRTKHRQKSAEALAMKAIKKQELLIKIISLSLLKKYIVAPRQK